MSKKLSIVDRKRSLSLSQVKEIRSKYSSLQYELISRDSYGDKNKSISLMDSSIPQDFFTRELDNALLKIMLI